MDIIGNIPLPTDSLYKFMALSGMVITLIFLIGPFYLRRKLNFLHIELTRDAKIEKFSINATLQSLDDMKEVVDNGRACVSEKSEEGVEVFSDKSLELLRKLATDSNSNSVEAVRKTENLSAEVFKLRYLFNEIRFLKWGARIGILLGLSLSISGFILWYIKLQKYINIAYSVAQSP